MRYRFGFQSALLLAFLLTACDPGAPRRTVAPADSSSARVPFELAGPGGAALVVPVFLNGEGPYAFVLDTGATLTCVDRSLAEKLGLPARRGGTGVGIGIGRPGRVGLVGIDSIRLGQTRAIDLLACVLDLNHLGAVGIEIDGLLGLNFLKPFRITLDFPGQELIVTAD